VRIVDYLKAASGGEAMEPVAERADRGKIVAGVTDLKMACSASGAPSRQRTPAQSPPKWQDCRTIRAEIYRKGAPR
jgi:hypothetical protein